MTALACARETLVGAMTDRLVAYVSDQAHSLARARRARPRLPARSGARAARRTTRCASAGDARRGDRGRLARRPHARSSSPRAPARRTPASSTRCAELAELCRERGVWLHVGRRLRRVRGPHRARPRAARRDRARGLGDARPAQVALPAVRVRLPAGPRRRALRAAFEMTPAYLLDARPRRARSNFADLGLQLTRTSRALKVWLSLRTSASTRSGPRSTARSTSPSWLAAGSRRAPTLELAAPPSLGVVCFRRRFDAATRTSRTAATPRSSPRSSDSGLGLVSSTRLQASSPSASA